MREHDIWNGTPSEKKRKYVSYTEYFVWLNVFTFSPQLTDIIVVYFVYMVVVGKGVFLLVQQVKRRREGGREYNDDVVKI